MAPTAAPLTDAPALGGGAPSATAAKWDSVLTELAERRRDFHAQSYVPRDFVARLKELGIYRASTPQQFGGEPMSPAEFLSAIERISAVDGSTGWVATFGSALTYLGSLPLETQAEIYREGPDVAYAGGLFPVNPVKETANGYLVSGRWKFASGCMGADWIGVGIPGDESTQGRPRAVVMRPEQVQIIQEWDVTGLKASGSFDIVVDNVEVPREWTFARGGPSNIDEPLHRYPAIGFQAQVFAAVSLGVAGAALEFVREAGSRTGITGAPPLASRPYYRIEFAKATAALRSARAWYFEVAEQVWDTVLAGDEVSPEQHAQIRISAANMADVAAKVVADLCATSGSATTNNQHPLQVLRQDVCVPQLHAFLGQSWYDAGGSVLLGQPSTVPGFS